MQAAAVAHGKRAVQFLNHHKRQITYTVVGTSLATFFITSRIATTAVVTGKSMAPTFNERSPQSRVLIDLMTPVTKVKENDIILAHDPEECDAYIVKRVKALAGQLVDVDEDNQGTYARKHAYQGKLTVPTGYCWLEGDNKYNSVDSREYGPLPLGLIKGRVLFTLWS